MANTEILQNKTELLDPKNATELMSAQQAGDTDDNFTGGFLKIGEVIEGWKITSQLNVTSLEAEVYRAKKGDKEGIVKYYRMVTTPKTDVLEKMQGMEHEDIVNLYKYGMHKGRLFEIMEYAAGGSMDSRNDDGSYKFLPLNEEETIGICEEMINAYKKCHEMGIIHRDIKPGNIYYRHCSDEPDANGKYKGNDIVIGDFGISSVMDENELYRKTRTATRTSAYAAPEINSLEINEKYDYYSLGITLWEIATGREPYMDETGHRPESYHIMRLSAEGFAADNLLSMKPLLSQKLQKLIRGLLVVNPEHRWGYQQVRDHLDGKEVPVFVEKKEIKFTIGNKNCTSLDEIAEAIFANPEAAHKSIYDGQLKAVLKRNFPEFSKRIETIAEESSAKKDFLNGIYKAAWSLSDKIAFPAGNGYTARNTAEIISLLANAPETMLPLLRNKNSKLYAYLEVLEKKDEADAIKAIADSCTNAELVSKAHVIISGRIITPYKLAKYKNFTLDTPENLTRQAIPGDLQNRILALIAEKSCEGLIYPWIDLHLKERGVTEYSPKTWNELIGLFKAA